MPYATAIVARFDHVPLRLACVNAGHPSGHLLRDGGASTLESGGPPLGLLPEAKYVASTVELQPGYIGVLVTDSITEALEGGPVTLTTRRSPDVICDYLLRAAAEGPGPEGVEGWQDDRTVFVFAVDVGA